MQPTTEQRDAINIHDKNLIVVAGAGSGKTRVLVERYIQLLACNLHWPLSALVAITFTREAAFEMRHRVRLELERRAARTNGHGWARHLSQIESARIDTIHGLCADILRANAALAGVDPKFEVLDEIEAAILLDEVVDDVLSDLNPPVSKLFAHYDGFKIEAALKQMSLVNADYPPPASEPDLIFARWTDEWEELLAKEVQRLLNSPEADAVRELDYLPAPDKLSDLVWQYRDYLLQIAAGHGSAQILELLRTCYADGAVGNKGSLKAWGDKETKQQVAQLLRDLRQSVKDSLDSVGEMPGELDRLTAELLPLWHTLLEQVRQAYEERKSAAARLDFDDLERLAAKLLTDADSRARYREAEFKHILVDEFQDTNAAQWQIIRSLADLESGGSLFTVGDPKQSIYQFRGADVSVFNRVRAQFARHEAGLELPLSLSFRSHGNLVNQFNALFERILASDEHSPVRDYEVAFDMPMHAFRQESPTIPAIELQLLDRDMRDESGEPIKGKRNRRQRYQAEDMRRWEAYEIAKHVKAILAAERQVYDKDADSWRGIEFRDIAILIQSMSNVTVYEDVFKAQDLPFLTIAGRGYYDRQEVWDMLELLRFLHNPADNLALATVLRSPMFAFSDDLLYILRLQPSDDEVQSDPCPLWQALQIAAESQIPGLTEGDNPLIQHACATLVELLRISGRVTISELLRQALLKTNYLAILTGLTDGDRRRGNIEKLLHLAEASGKVTLGKFSQYLMDLTAREVRESEAHQEAGNAMRLMTVHASKGLEFPLVVLVDASWERRSQGAPTLHVDPESGLSCQVFDTNANNYVSGFVHQHSHELQTLKEAAERKRLLYVAATRAQDYLFISGQVTQTKDGSWASSGWLKQLLAALELEDLERKPLQLCRFSGSDIVIMMPQSPPARADLYGSGATGPDLWDYAADDDQYAPCAPPLIKPLTNLNQPSLSHITASQIADIGEYRNALSQRQQSAAARRFRQSAINALPAGNTTLLLQPNLVTPVIIGDIVHEVLRFRSFALEQPTPEPLIQAIAWDKGVTNQDSLRLVLRRVQDYLEQYSSSDIYNWIAQARADSRPLYTELPFMYRTDKRVIHGVIDVVLQQPTGEWAIIDYKTSEVICAAYERHADRFLLQLGIYSAALRAKLDLDQLPQAFVHYLAANRTIPLSSEACMAELDRLESTIGELVAHED